MKIIDIELVKQKKDRKEALLDIITMIIGLIIIIILGLVIAFQADKISNLEDENFNLFVEVQGLKEVIDSEYRNQEE